MIDILRITHEERMMYGLRHDNYSLYRKHCTHRVRRTRQLLKQNTQIDKQLQLYLYETERAWAYGMELKQELVNSIDTRARHHLMKRLKRATQYAAQLVKLSPEVDKRTAYDIQAYSSLMNGYLLIEQKQFKEAFKQLVEARTIYEVFSQQTSDAEQEILYYSAMDTIDPNIRFCAYKLQMPGTTVEEWLKQQDVSELHQSLSSWSKKSSLEVQWGTQTLTIDHPALLTAIQEAQKTGHWNEAHKVARRVLKENKKAMERVGSSKSMDRAVMLEKIGSYVHYQLNESLIQRILKEDIHIGSYDSIIKALEEDMALPYVENSLEEELELQLLYYKAKRCIQVAHVYDDRKKTLESLALYQHAQTYLVQVKQRMRHVSFSLDMTIEEEIRSGIWKSRALYYLDHPTEELDMAQLTLEDDHYLIHHLDSYPQQIKQLVEFPPAFQPVAAKPFYFDLAANYIHYPVMPTEKESAGIWKLFGFK